MNADSISSHDNQASVYDDQAKQYDHYGGEVVFGLMYEFVKPRECLLDMGIGTGLGSMSFARHGLHVHGVDASGDMIAVCAAKGFTVSLTVADLRRLPLPFEDAAFDHVISVGVFHFFEDVSPLIGEAARLVKPGGVVAFSVAALTANEELTADTSRGCVPNDTAWDVTIYRHRHAHVARLLAEHGFEILKKQGLVIKGAKEGEDDLHRVYVARRPRRLPEE